MCPERCRSTGESIRSTVDRGLVAGLLIFLTGLVVAAPDGRALYETHCAACHQFDGDGGIGLPLSSDKLDDVSDDYLRRSIRLGRPGRVMPAYQRMSDAQVDAIVRYLRERSQTQEMVFSDERIAGDITRGERLYTQHCLECHGSDGAGEGEGTGVTLSRDRAFLVMPASISNPGFLASAPDGLIEHSISVGRKSSGMPGFARGKLSAEEIRDVVAYVRTFEVKDSARTGLPADERPTRLYQSPYDFETTLDNLKMALSGANFRIFPDRFLEQGLYDEFSVNQRQVGIRFCNFNLLYGMLKIEPRLGVVLPCRITVMERPDGTVMLAVPNLRVVSRWFNNDELVGLWDEMEESFAEIIEEAML